MKLRLSTLVQDKLLSHLFQRLIAIDLGSSHIKVILAEKKLGKINLLEHQIIDLQAEGLLSAEEINRHLREVVEVLGNYPVALAVPQHVSISHMVDLPIVPEREVTKLIHQETINLGGLSGGGVIYQYHRLLPFGAHANPFWVTLSQEHEINNQINRLKDESGDLSFARVQTTANALITAWLSVSKDSDRVVLVDLGSTSTVVAVVENRQGVFATSFPIGGESFTSQIASWRKCGYEEAELIKRSEDLFSESAAPTGLVAVVDIWLEDLRKMLMEWEDDNPDHRNPGQPIHVVLGGGGAVQPGLMAYLQKNPGFEFRAWPALPGISPEFCLHRYAAAYGLVMQSFFSKVGDGSLLPAEQRTTRVRQVYLQRATWSGFALLALLLVLVMVGMVQKIVLNERRAVLVADTEGAARKALAIESLIHERETQYAELLPLVEHQKKTADILKTLQVLQEIRGHRDLWFLSFADQESYITGATCRPPETNFFGPYPLGANTNRIELPAGFVAELYIPDKGEDKLKVLNSVVDDLAKEKIFRNVDSIAPNQRNTNFVDPRIMTPDRIFSLSLELSEKECPRPFLAQSTKTNLNSSFPSPR